MDGHETAAATCVYRHAWSVEIEVVRDAVCHDGDAIPRCCILRLPVRVAQTNLLIVYTVALEPDHESVGAGRVPLTKDPT